MTARTVAAVLFAALAAGGAGYVVAVTASPPETVAAETLPDGPRPPLGPGWHGVGRVEVSVYAASPGGLAGSVRIHPKRPSGAVTVSVPVTGRAARPVEVSPSVLVPPRQSDAGPVYAGEWACRSTGGGPLALSVDSADPGLRAEILPAPAFARVVVVRVHRDPAGAPGPDLRKVRLKATVAGQSILVETPVDCRR